MNKNSSEVTLVKRSLYSALISFSFGTLLFAVFYWTEYIVIALFGILFVLIAIAVNGSFLIRLLSKIFSRQANIGNGLISILILMSNIPIAIIYFEIAVNIIVANVALD